MSEIIAKIVKQTVNIMAEKECGKPFVSFRYILTRIYIYREYDYQNITGKRMCIGDKFAMNVLFLILTRLLQATNGLKLILNGVKDLDLEPRNFRLSS
jgi:hypothetical protein